MMATNATTAPAVSPLIRAADFPPACSALQVAVFQRFNAQCLSNCLPFGPTSNPLDIFTIPTDATNCGEFEEDLCVYSSCCLSARGAMNRLYRCVLRNIDTTAVPYLNGIEITDTLLNFANVCPLSCLPGNYDLPLPAGVGTNETTPPAGVNEETTPPAAIVTAIMAPGTMPSDMPSGGGVRRALN